MKRAGGLTEKASQLRPTPEPTLNTYNSTKPSSNKKKKPVDLEKKQLQELKGVGNVVQRMAKARQVRIIAIIISGARMRSIGKKTRSNNRKSTIYKQSTGKCCRGEQRKQDIEIKMS